MKRTLVKLRNSRLRKFLIRHEKYALLVFFMGGFVFDWLTLGRIDRLYDLIWLSSHMTLLSVTLYLFNLAPDQKWRGTLIDRYEIYFPYAIQFFFGALSSAYVVYFSRSVSLSKTVSFFVLLLLLLIANEFLKQRISNKYLQFGVYSFLSFTFFTFIVPVFLAEMNNEVFILSGILSLICTLALAIIIYLSSPSTREEVSPFKLYGLILAVYICMNLFYAFKLIPPVPLALDCGIAAHYVEKTDDDYIVTFETDEWYVFWRMNRLKFIHTPNEPVYVYTSIFAPTELEKSIIHRWQWYNSQTAEWEITDNISYDIMGGRDEGFRGYTFKNNVKDGQWKVEVMTPEGLVIGVVDFNIITDPNKRLHRLVKRTF